MSEWKVWFSRTWKDETRINCEMSSATCWAEDEDEVRAIFAEEYPDWSVDKIEWQADETEDMT